MRHPLYVGRLTNRIPSAKIQIVIPNGGLSYPDKSGEASLSRWGSWNMRVVKIRNKEADWF